jgi:hypothetical protein
MSTTRTERYNRELEERANEGGDLLYKGVSVRSSDFSREALLGYAFVVMDRLRREVPGGFLQSVDQLLAL